MPRKPTGRPTGRPKGSGTLGSHTRLTVRIPQTLYARLDSYAAGRSFHRGQPELAICVREALEAYLTKHTSRQTESIPALPANRKSQPESDTHRQPESDPAPTRDVIRQPESVPIAAETSLRQTQSTSPMVLAATDRDTRPLGVSAALPQLPVLDYDAARYTLGPLCVNGHDYEGIGQSLRRLASKECAQCCRERDRAYRARALVSVTVET